MTATAALTTELQRQVLILEDDLRARLAADPVREGQLEAGAPAGHRQGPDGRLLGHLARRPDHPGRRGLGPDHGVHPVLRGQRPAAPGMDHRPRQPGGRKRWTPSSRSSASIPRTPTANGSWTRSTT